MNKDAIYYTLHMKNEKGLDFYGMLYYSLETLMEFYDGSYDIVVVWSTNADWFDMHDYEYLGKYNIPRDFAAANIKFVKSDYNDEDVFMHRWYNFERVFEIGYERVFYIDSDVMYFGKPNQLFDRNKYAPGSFYVLTEGSNQIVLDVLERNGAAMGQVLVDRDTFYSVNDLYGNISRMRLELIDKAKRVLQNENDCNWFCNLVEQYAAYMVFINQNIPVGGLYLTDVCFGPECHRFRIVGNHAEFTEMYTTIFHYFGNCGYYVVPDRLRTDNMKNVFNQNKNMLPH